MRETTERDERTLGLRAWICDKCKSEQILPDQAPEPPLDNSPTDTEPGSPEREAVYRSRLKRGKALLHPQDRQAAQGNGPPVVSTSALSRDPRDRGIRRRGGRWQARIWCDGRQVNLGSFLTLEEACAARDAAERKREAA